LTIAPAGRLLGEAALTVEVVPGYYSKASDLQFTFNVTSYTPRTMEMQILFAKPLYVSKDFESREFLEVTFVTKYFFFDTEGLFLPDNFKVRREIPT